MKPTFSFILMLLSVCVFAQKNNTSTDEANAKSEILSKLDQFSAALEANDQESLKRLKTELQSTMQEVAGSDKTTTAPSNRVTGRGKSTRSSSQRRSRTEVIEEKERLVQSNNQTSQKEEGKRAELEEIYEAFSAIDVEGRMAKHRLQKLAMQFVEKLEEESVDTQK